MKAQYYYNSSALDRDIASDLYEIFTGETVVSSLSSGCDKGSTVIDATIPSGWTKHDGTSNYQKVMKAPHAHKSDKYKYCRITATGYNIGDIYFQIYDYWDNTDQSFEYQAQNPQFGGADYNRWHQEFNRSAGGGGVFIGSTERFAIMVGYQGTYYGSPAGFGGLMVAEFDREYYPGIRYNEDAPSFCIVSFSQAFRQGAYQSAFIPYIQTPHPRILYDSGTTSHFFMAGQGFSRNDWRNTNTYPDQDDLTYSGDGLTSYEPAMPLYLARMARYAPRIGSFSKICDVYASVYYTTAGVETFSTKTANNGKTYTAFQGWRQSSTGTNRMMVWARC